MSSDLISAANQTYQVNAAYSPSFKSIATSASSENWSVDAGPSTQLEFNSVDRRIAKSTSQVFDPMPSPDAYSMRSSIDLELLQESPSASPVTVESLQAPRNQSKCPFADFPSNSSFSSLASSNAFESPTSLSSSSSSALTPPTPTANGPEALIDEGNELTQTASSSSASSPDSKLAFQVAITDEDFPEIKIEDPESEVVSLLDSSRKNENKQQRPTQSEDSSQKASCSSFSSPPSTDTLQAPAIETALQLVKEKVYESKSDRETLPLVSIATLAPVAASASSQLAVASLPLSHERYAYCLEYITKVRDYYLRKDIHYFPDIYSLSSEIVDMYVIDIAEHFKEIEEPLANSAALKQFNKVIFDRIHEAINTSQLQYTDRIDPSCGGRFVLRPEVPITVATMIERVAPLFQNFKANSDSPLLYPLSAEYAYHEACARLGVPDLLGLFDNNQHATPIVELDRLIKEINKIEKKGCAPCPPRYVSTLPSFELIYNRLMVIRDEISIILKECKEDQDEFTLELDDCYNTYPEQIGDDLAALLLEELIKTTVAEFNAIDAKKAARRAAEKLKKEAKVTATAVSAFPS